MIKMKPEDVMKALECCCGIAKCVDCPYCAVEECAKQNTIDAIALLREKDALIAELTQTNAKKTALIEELQLGWSEDQERVRKLLDAKDANIKVLKIEVEALHTCIKKLNAANKAQEVEIEKLIKERDEVRRDVGVAERNHYESAKEVDRLRHICTCYALEYGTVMDQSKAVKKIRDEAITEFAERLKEHECMPENPWEEPYVLAEYIAQIAKEMKGEI